MIDRRRNPDAGSLSLYEEKQGNGLVSHTPPRPDFRFLHRKPWPSISLPPSSLPSATLASRCPSSRVTLPSEMRISGGDRARQGTASAGHHPAIIIIIIIIIMDVVCCGVLHCTCEQNLAIFHCPLFISLPSPLPPAGPSICSPRSRISAAHLCGALWMSEALPARALGADHGERERKRKREEGGWAAANVNMRDDGGSRRERAA